jgi:sulfur-oxidizing protein SoxA
LKRRAALLAACSLAAGSFAQSPPPEAFVRPDKGHCVACHQLPEAAGRPGGGDMGPALTGARMRELGAAGLRSVIEDPMKANPGTAMPPYGRHHILDAAEITRLVQYLQALPDGAPAAAQPAAEGAGNPSGAGAAAVIERGRTLWQRKFKDKRSLASCFPNGGRRIAAAYPQYDPRVKRVITLETAINLCLKTHKEALLDPADPETMGPVVAYVRSLADGQKVAVRVPADAEPKLEEGRRLYFTRMGQRNFACASCHVQAAGKRYGESVLSPVAGQAAHGPLLHNGKAVTLQSRMRECLERMGAAPFPAGSDELNHLEYFITRESNGVTMKTAARREPS